MDGAAGALLNNECVVFFFLVYSVYVFLSN